MKEIIKHKAWAIGLGRTGTTTFCEALKILGYQKVVHNPIFEELKNLDGASDNGCTIFYKYLDYKFPGSKFVLLWRDLEDWLESARYIHGTIPDRDQDLMIMRRMLVYGRIDYDKDQFAKTYHEHHKHVREYFKDRPDDLLEMNIVAGDGWETLCPFLGLSTPDVPFPHKNKRKPPTAFERLVKAVKGK